MLVPFQFGFGGTHEPAPALGLEPRLIRLTAGRVANYATQERKRTRLGRKELNPYYEGQNFARCRYATPQFVKTDSKFDTNRLGRKELNPLCRGQNSARCLYATSQSKQDRTEPAKGFEPPTFCSEGSCSIQLSYAGKAGAAGAPRSRTVRMAGFEPGGLSHPKRTL